jgi:hypothetical protein
MITITEVTGNENISLARLTYNNNFLLIENEINELEDVFNINLNTGSLDCSTAVGGEIRAKTIAANQISLPVSSPSITIFGTSGSISGSGAASFATLSISGTGSINNLNATGATFSTRAFFGGTASFGNVVQYGTGARVVNSNVIVEAGVTGGTDLLTYSGSSGGGVTGTFNNPYIINGTEKIIYADTALVSGGFTGFFMQVEGGSGSTGATLPAGYTITIVSTSATGTIPSGITGNSPSSHFYTGLNSTLFGSNINITTPTQPFKTAITLMWEPRINQGQPQEVGSWIVINSTNNLTY